nr:M15 family metallopeptidase [uncultured Roseibium sp.]
MRWSLDIKALGLAVTILLSCPVQSAELPDGLVYLKEIDASIIQDMRYATRQNFTGRKVPGYLAGECILTRKAASDLSKVNSELNEIGLGLKVFDCYRPERAVAAFVDWVGAAERTRTRKQYHPNVPKNALIPKYIASRSSHSTARAVDVTIYELHKSAKHDEGPCASSGRSTQDLDMGTTFDCFDPLSETHNKTLSRKHRVNRSLLLDAMERHRFRNYSGEWWHFTHQSGASKRRYDFPIEPR